jgi:hypothetical protein
MWETTRFWVATPRLKNPALDHESSPYCRSTYYEKCSFETLKLNDTWMVSTKIHHVQFF